MLTVNLKNISLKSSEVERTLLSEINFSLSSNKIHTIIGSNGAGKSTLLKSLTGLLPESSFKITGEVLYENINLLDCSEEQIKNIRREKIKYIFQDPVTSFDPLRRLGYYFRGFIPVREDFVNELLEYFMLPPGEILFEMYPHQLSGGMAQRLSLALASAASPEILLLDEPTSGIDAPMVNLVIHFLKNFVKVTNNTVLLVTHDLLYAKAVSDLIALLEDGHISAFLPVDDFFNEKKLTLNRIYD
ncbi:MAG: hypothetical protein Kow0098_21640 [Ignavibacteriaceae bacterium]